MLRAGRDAVSFCQDRSIDQLRTDALFRRALVHALQEVGEAASRISAEGRARIPSLPWGKIVGARNILIHVYWGVDHEQVWRMATLDVPDLLAALESACAAWPMGTTGPSAPS
ncbi:MAG: DUF86 domain-containing protein [Phycisphaerales bacterium]|nr:DUF86 domain-containing protein [Phycisphaerales bacterium]